MNSPPKKPASSGSSSPQKKAQSADLEREAHDFAQRTSDLLNGTVTTGVRITSVLNPASGACFVGYRVSRRDHAALEPIPLTISKADPSCFLLARHVLRLDPEGEHLMDARCVLGVYADPLKRQLLVRYDYNRDLSGHASAHVHVNGDSTSLGVLSGRTGARPDLERMHFPVGGKRYRPCLEDVVEFLIGEGLARSHRRWQQVVDHHRDDYHRLQLRAAVRRDQVPAADELATQGWTVVPPAEN